MNPSPRSGSSLSRRTFLAASGLGAAALLAPRLGRAAVPAAAPAPKRLPLGIELYAVRKELQRDLPATLREVARIGYEVVEFYSPYLGWTFPYAKEVRTMLDDLGLKCFSTHNSGAAALVDEGTRAKAIELNQILGARHIIAASPPRGVNGVDGWKQLAGQLTAAADVLRPHGLLAGFHNHAVEWKPAADGGPRCMDLLAEGTPGDFVLQLDVGTAVQAGVDTIAWIQAHPGRIRSLHLKDWTPGEAGEEKGFRVLFGEGASPWKEIFAAAESVGGAEFYLMEQEGSRYSELETAERCLANYRRMRG
ncbi:MAG TPA: sugar phosphate isomerase/epimerase [Opitutaceae bacterium]|nr:sugar phosphate isomerase/epimerase [Opitutaceae bacterium]